VRPRELVDLHFERRQGNPAGIIMPKAPLVRSLLDLKNGIP
jgi:hypothetical protein